MDITGTILDRCGSPVAFHRLIMQDGCSVNRDHVKGMKQIGGSCLRDKVNTHYFRMFGASLADGGIGEAARATF
ncbi:MAG: hypothetical protein ACRD5R_16670 [Candidatus Acidiferrales bacterium]